MSYARQARSVERGIERRVHAELGERLAQRLQSGDFVGWLARRRHRPQQRLRIAVPAALEQRVDDLRERRRLIRHPGLRLRQVRRRPHIVDVERRAADEDALARQRLAEGVEEHHRRILHRRQDQARFAADRHLPAHREHAPARHALADDAGWLIGRDSDHLVVHQQPAAHRRHRDDAGRTGRHARSDEQLDLILVVLQRANRRAVAGDEIVPRPARAKPRLGKGVVVADEMTVDHLHAARGNLCRPTRRAPPTDRDGAD